ncbi:MAG: RNA recognition motif domain-containing protein [Planctomycetota bacterium]|jgi:RNA recognition motif-containing protein
MKIYVGNLSYDVAESDLEQAFGEFGQVSSVSLIKDKQTGESKGFGFVEMPEVSEGQAAVKEMNGKEFMGRELKVDQAKERAARPGGGRGGFGGRGGGGGGGRRFGGSGGGNRSGNRSGGGGNRDGGSRNRY